MDSNMDNECQINKEIKPLEKFKQNRKISISEKIKAIEFSKNSVNKKASNKYDITSK